MKDVQRAGVPVRIAHSHSTGLQHHNAAQVALYRPYHVTINRWLLYQYATHILAASTEAGKFLMGSHWLRLDKTQNLFCGIQLDTFADMAGQRADALLAIRSRNLERYHIRPDAIVVANVGRMQPMKNQGFLIRAFRTLVDRDRRHVLFIAGDGPLRKHLADIVARLNLDENVVMPGVCDNVPELMAHVFDTLTLPSVFEGFGIVVLEAIAAGLHCVCSDVLTEDLRAAFPNRITTLPLMAAVEDWCTAISDAVSDKIALQDGIALVAQSPFTLEHSLDRLLSIYNEAEEWTEH
jgi:glycosyltransferase involved in cell wall biosynthesis